MKRIDLKSFTIAGVRVKSRGNFVAVLMVLLSFSDIPASAHNDGCSNTTLKDDYSFTISGYRPNPDGTTSPKKGVAITHFDGAGNLTQRDFVVTAGVPSSGSGNSVTGFEFSTGETGTYTTNTDCTDSAEIHLHVPVPFGLREFLNSCW